MCLKARRSRWCWWSFARASRGSALHSFVYISSCSPLQPAATAPLARPWKNPCSLYDFRSLKWLGACRRGPRKGEEGRKQRQTKESIL